MRFLALILGCMLLGSCQGVESDRAVLRVGLAQMPITMDPRFATDAASMRVQDFVHRGLLTLDEQFQVQGDLAERWDNPEPLLWRFHLTPGVVFSNGAKLGAADVVATLNALLDPKLASPLKASFEAIDSLAVESDLVFVIRLKKADASLLTRLNFGILPASLATGPHQAHSTIGCGAYKLEAWTENSITLQRVDAHASVASIRFNGVKDPVTRILKLTRGELDFVQNDLPPHLLPYIKAQKNMDVQTAASTTFSYIGLNMQDKLLSDIRIRRALAMALDRAKLKQALFADLPELAQTVLTGTHWASTRLPPLVYGRDQAERLLDEAGYKRGVDGIRFTISFRTSTDPTRLRLATAIAAMWEEVGVNVSIESLEWGGFYARIKQGDFQVFSLAWVGITDPDVYRLILHSEMWPPKGANRGRYANAQMDQWLDTAAEAGTQAERKAIYARVEKQMQDDMVYIPLWFDPVIAVSGPRLSGFIPKPDGSLRGLMHVMLTDQVH